MRVYVTGAAGFLGTHLRAELAGRGYVVGGCDLLHNGEIERCDVGEFRQLERALTEFKPDVVYHAAAEFGRHNGEDYYEQVWRTNVVGTKNVVRLQENMGFRLVFFSSSEIYGDFGGRMKESVSDTEPLRQLNDYAISKWVGEQQVMNSADRFGTESVRVRLFNTYGPGEVWSPYRSVVCLFVHAALNGLPYTVFRGYRRTSTYVDDMVRTLANIAGRFKPGAVYNIAGEETHDIELLSALVLEATGGDPALVKYLDQDEHNTVAKLPDITRAQSELGHECKTGLEAGVKATVAWQRGFAGGIGINRKVA